MGTVLLRDKVDDPSQGNRIDRKSHDSPIRNSDFIQKSVMSQVNCALRLRWFLGGQVCCTPIPIILTNYKSVSQTRYSTQHPFYITSFLRNVVSRCHIHPIIHLKPQEIVIDLYTFLHCNFSYEMQQPCQFLMTPERCFFQRVNKVTGAIIVRMTNRIRNTGGIASRPEDFEFSNLENIRSYSFLSIYASGVH